jgi:KaiC/GvpD/RAD55 family RecA-like ATPase
VSVCPICGREESELRQVARVAYLDGREVHFCLECFVNGTVSEGAILLLGPPTAGKTGFCKTFALESGRPVIYLPTDETAENLLKEFNEAFAKTYGKTKVFDQEDELRILDCYSALMGKKAQTKYALQNLSNLSEISITLKAAWNGLTGSCLVVDDSALLGQEAGEDTTLKFLRQLVANLRGMHSLGLFSVTTGILGRSFENSLLSIFDGVLEMKVEDGPDGLERLIRIYSLRGQKHSTKWTRFDITDEGIVVAFQGTRGQESDGKPSSLGRAFQ